MKRSLFFPPLSTSFSSPHEEKRERQIERELNWRGRERDLLLLSRCTDTLLRCICTSDLQRTEEKNRRRIKTKCKRSPLFFSFLFFFFFLFSYLTRDGMLCLKISIRERRRELLAIKNKKENENVITGSGEKGG